MAADLDISLLRTFIAIVDTGSLTGAGRLVGRTQPAISHQARRLEEAVGRPLFGADKRHLTLTRDGEVLLDYARRALRLNDEMVASLQAPVVEGHVALGTPDLYAAYLLPGILGSFSTAYPGIEIELRCQRSVFLLSALKSEQVDLAILTRQPEQKTGRVVRREPLVWVTGPQSRPEDDNVLPLALLPKGSVYRQRALDALGRQKRRWSITSISDSIAGLQAAVYAGLAVTVLPRCAVSPAMRCLGPAEGLPALPAIDLVMVSRRRGLSSAAEHLADYIAQRLRHVEPFRAHEVTPYR